MYTNSIIDQDLYKFTTSYAYMKMFPQATGTFKFCDRNHTKYTKEEVAKIIQRVWHLQNLALTDEEANFMKNACYFIPTYYFDWLKSFRFDPKQLNITYNEETKELGIEATGLLYEVTLWEVPILAIISEVQTLEQGPIDTSYIIRKTVEKATIAERNNLKFSEFGTRRRASFSIQDLVVETLAKNCPTSLTGTSNCFFAMKYHLTPIGTHPHEWFMFHGAMYGYEHANYMALENWINVYDGDLGIALSDTYTSDVFFKNFSKKHAKLYDGIRQDSGDPFRFIEKAINRYKELKVNPLTKTIIFSDALTMDKAVEINNNCIGRIGCAFGIGTHLTNDCGLKPANIVMKLTECRMNSKQPSKHCVKLSDAEGKHMGDPDEVSLALLTINQHYK